MSLLARQGDAKILYCPAAFHGAPNVELLQSARYAGQFTFFRFRYQRLRFKRRHLIMWWWTAMELSEPRMTGLTSRSLFVSSQFRHQQSDEGFQRVCNTWPNLIGTSAGCYRRIETALLPIKQKKDAGYPNAEPKTSQSTFA